MRPLIFVDEAAEDVMPRVLGQDVPEVLFSVDQHVVEALAP